MINSYPSASRAEMQSPLYPLTMNIKPCRPLVALALLAGLLSTHAQTAAFTYQGRLNDTNGPASGTYDLQFTLLDALSSGSIVAGPLTSPATAVSNGLFTATLDFGAAAFPGANRWLEIQVKTNGALNFTPLIPRQQVTAAPYAIQARNAAAAVAATTAGTAYAVANDAVTSSGIAVGQVVKSLNTLKDDVTLAPGDNLTLTPAGQTLTLASPTDWHLTGNAGTTPGASFLGTTDNQELDFKVNNVLGLRLLAGAGHPSLIGGDASNFAAPDCFNTFIGGGILNVVTNTTYYSAIGAGFGNRIAKLSPDWYPDNAVISGGIYNTNAGYAAVVPGGEANLAYGEHSFAAGYHAKATNRGTFVWADRSGGDFSSTANNQFLIRASGGVGLGTNNPHAALEVAGTVLAQNFIGSVAGLAGTITNTLSFNPPAGPPFAVGNSTVVANLNADLLDGYSSSAFWNVGGNSGTVPGNFLGTTDFTPLEFRVWNSRGLRLEYASSSSGYVSSQDGINVIGGFWGNAISNGVVGATIAGGGDTFWTLMSGSTDYPNVVTGSFGTVGGGYNNTAGNSGTVPGGYNNTATGTGSFAAGANAHATNSHSFVWSDGTATSSSANNSFDIRASGGVHINETDLFLRANNDRNDGLGWRSSFSGISLDGPVLYGWNSGALGTVGPDTVSLKWDWHGNVWVSNNLSVATLTIRGGADIAEPFPVADGEVEPGCVMVIDETHPGQLARSSEAYDKRVAGIISGAGGVQPGLELHQEGVLSEGRKVALTGRVYVNADATGGSIKPGDLLTTSTTPGCAMKATDPIRAQGAILGKAMSRLENGKGLVLVLVTLQ